MTTIIVSSKSQADAHKDVLLSPEKVDEISRKLYEEHKIRDTKPKQKQGQQIFTVGKGDAQQAKTLIQNFLGNDYKVEIAS